MDRFFLTDEQWSKMEPFCLGKPGDPGRTGGDNRLFVEAVLWIMRTGSPWRDLPPWFGKWTRRLGGAVKSAAAQRAARRRRLRAGHVQREDLAQIERAVPRVRRPENDIPPCIWLSTMDDRERTHRP